MPLKLLLDENLRSGALWQAIQEHQKQGAYPLDIQRVGDEGAISLGESDEAILRWAASGGRVLITQDARSIETALARLQIAGSVSPGVVMLRKGLSNPEMLELLVLLAYCSEHGEWQNAVHWIP